MSSAKNFEFKYTIKEKDAAGKEVKIEKTGTAENVLQFESVSDVLAYFEQQEAGKGEALLVAEINSSFKSTAVANKRAELTRKPILPKSIAAKASEKLDSSEMETFNALMSKLGLTQLPPAK